MLLIILLQTAVNVLNIPSKLGSPVRTPLDIDPPTAVSSNVYVYHQIYISIILQTTSHEGSVRYNHSILSDD